MEKFATKLNEMVCDILKYGYKLPSDTGFSNNYLAFKNSEFADESIKEMLRAGTMKVSLTKPKVIDLLSVPIKGKKKRLILDLRYEKIYLYKGNKGKIHFGGWKNFQNYLEGIKSYLFKFDLKHGIMMSIYLTISTVLPFGMRPATFPLIKVVRPLIKYWR